jgi:hypothetical protein
MAGIVSHWFLLISSLIGLTIFFLLLNRRWNKNKNATDYIDQNEDFYLNGDQVDFEPIEVCAFT